MKNPICLKFAQTMAKVCGMTYAEATKKYPKGYNSISVYIDGVKTHQAHCVHCARAEVISKYSGA